MGNRQSTDAVDRTGTGDATSDAVGGYRMELLVRSFAPHGARDRLADAVDRLRDLEGESVIDAFTVTVVGERLCPETAAETERGRSILRKFERFREWGRRHDVSLEPCFEQRTVESMVDETYAAIVPPVMCLAVYDGPDLWGVFPSVDDDRRCSVGDCLHSFEDGVPGTPFEVRMGGPSAQRA